MLDDFVAARERFKPLQIRYLMVAEAPPRRDSGRFFYFLDVTDGDSLFLETMKVLYPNDCLCAGDIRPRKRELLERFRDDGFFLIDAVDEPFTEKKRSYKLRRIREEFSNLKAKLTALCEPDTKIILIAEPVHKVCAERLRSDGVNVINDGMIDFPGSSRQPKFRRKFSAVLAGARERRST